MAAFRLPESFRKRQEEKKNVVVHLNGEDIRVRDLPNQSVTLEEYKGMRMNSDGYEALIPKLNQEALEYAVQHCLNNCSRKNVVTYDGALQELFVPELLKRIKK